MQVLMHAICFTDFRLIAAEHVALTCILKKCFSPLLF